MHNISSLFRSSLISYSIFCNNFCQNFTPALVKIFYDGRNILPILTILKTFDLLNKNLDSLVVACQRQTISTDKITVLEIL